MSEINGPSYEPSNKTHSSEADKVGWGKPPKDSQFKPGQSGNPKGRPKGSKNKLKQRDVENLWMNEGHRIVGIQDQGGLSKMSVAQIIMRTTATKAMKGNLPASKFVLQQIHQAERSRHERMFSEAQGAYNYKQRNSDYIRLNKHARDFEMPIPHPDHVQIDEATLEVTLTGPKDRKALGYWKVVIYTIAQMEVEAMLKGCAHNWIERAMAYDASAEGPPLCEHNRQRAADNLTPHCEEHSCLVQAVIWDDEAMTMTYYKRFRETVPDDDPLWLEYGPAYKRRWIDYYFYYGENFSIAELELIKPSFKKHSKPEFCDADRLSLKKLKLSNEKFNAFMREKLEELMGDAWLTMLDEGYHEKRDIELDKMRYEYDTGIFNPVNYEIDDNELVLFRDEAFLRIYMCWRPHDERLAALTQFWKEQLEAFG